MLNNYLMSTQHASRAFYFNPEGNVGDGTVPNESEEVRRTVLPEEEPATETPTETTTASTTH